MARPAFRHKGVYDKQLEALVGASSWKQAINTCEKRIKKGDKTDETLVSLIKLIERVSANFTHAWDKA